MKLNPFAMMNREPDGKGIVFDPGKNQALTLNDTGVVVWEALENGLDVPQTIQRLVDEFDVTPDVAAKDLQFFLDALKNEGLLAEE